MQMIPLFMETFFFWYNRGGLDQMTMYFQNATVENADLAEALMLSSMSFHVSKLLVQISYSAGKTNLEMLYTQTSAISDSLSNLFPT